MITPLELMLATIGASVLFSACFYGWVKSAILSPLPVAPSRRRRRSSSFN